ncbi:MAG: hypothetical protein U1D31_03000 [Patescibacteria group bacterium]|nr:hypothetical protein [bacterium]MDZ4241061.1 hypothetical protein [Patescibacteria group bacterium]
MFKRENKKIFLKLLSSFLLLLLVLVPFFVNAQQASTQESGEKCGWTNMAGCIEMAWGKLVGSIADLILSLAAFVTFAAGTLLDFVIKYTIVDMSANVGVITGISTAWAALRDLANIFFIFILLYAAIATVLQMGGVNTKKIITRVIIIALLINFSLFFTRVMIDVSNALSVGFYNAILSGVSGSDGISYAYMQKLLLTTVYQPGSGAGADLTKFPEVGFLGAIFFLVAAFVFLAAAVMFITRFVVLVFLMITSAPAFAAMALPNDKYSGDWWKALWDQLIFAPVFFILSWATLQVLDGALGTLGAGASLKDAIAGSMDANGNKTAIPGAAAVFANFGIAITFMIVTLTISKKLAGSAGKGIQSFVGGVVGGATIGGAAWLGRRTLGWAGDRLSQNTSLQGAAGQNNLAGKAARLTLQGTKNLSRASFDARNIKTLGIGETISREGSLGKGKGQGGYVTSKDSQRERVLKDDQLRVAGARTAIVSTGLAPTATGADILAMQQQVSKMSTNDIENTSLANLQRSEFATGLSHSQMEDIKKSTKFTQTESNLIENRRDAGLVNLWNASGSAGLFAVTKRAKPNEMAELPQPILVDPNFAQHLSVPALQRITNEGTLGFVDKALVRANIIAAAALPTNIGNVQLQKTASWLASPQGSIF